MMADALKGHWKTPIFEQAVQFKHPFYPIHILLHQDIRTINYMTRDEYQFFGCWEGFIASFHPNKG